MAYCTLSPDLPLLEPAAPIMFPDGWWCNAVVGVDGEVDGLDVSALPSQNTDTAVGPLEAPVLNL